MHPKSKNYEKARIQALKEYKKIQEIRCPLLNNERIYFNNAGFKHLIRKERVRSLSEQQERFRLLPYAKEIITDPSSVVQYRKKVLKGLMTQYWSLTNSRDNKIIKVIMRQVGEGQKHFYSIYRVA